LEDPFDFLLKLLVSAFDENLASSSFLPSFLGGPTLNTLFCLLLQEAHETLSSS
jgi:hypothetical protein